MLPKFFSQDDKHNDRLWMAWIIVLVVGMVGALAGVQFPIPPLPTEIEQPEIAARGISHFSGLDITGAETTDLVVFDQTSTGDILELQDNDTTVWTFADGGTATQSDGDLVVADDIRVTAQTAITVTDSAAFTPTGTYQGIIAAAEVTPTITIGTAGDLLVLINTGAQTINIADSGTVKLSAAWAATADDVLVLWCDGTDWIEISRTAN
jgi:hypothetical protein